MNNISLKKAVFYSKKRAPLTKFSINNYISTDNILQNKKGIVDAVKLPPNGTNVSAFDRGHILVANIRPYLKKIWYANKSGGCSADVLNFQVNEGFDSKFVYYNMFRDDFFVHMMKGSKGSKMPRGDKEQVLNYIIPNYEINTQKKIASVLSALDSKIDLNHKINSELEAISRTLYDYWFVQFDFPNELGRPYKSSGGKMVWSNELKREIPQGWDVKCLSDLTQVSNESLNPLDYSKKEFKHYSIPSFDESSTYKMELGNEIKSNKFVVKNSDILVSKLNPWFNRVIYSTEEEDLISSTEFVIWRTKNIKMKNYLYMLARDPSFISYSINSATGTSNSHRRVNPSVMMKFKIAYKNNIAELFGLKVGPSIKMLSKNQIENKFLADLRDWLLPVLMNGQVKVTTDLNNKQAQIVKGPLQTPLSLDLTS